MAAGKRLVFSLGVPPSVEGTTSKNLGLLLRGLVNLILLGGSLYARAQGHSVVVLMGVFLLAWFLLFDARTFTKLK